MTTNEARAAVLAALNRLSIQELKMPGTDTLYPADRIRTGIILPFRVAPDVRDFLRQANALSLASIDASIDKALDERRSVQRAAHRQRRRRR